jgi:dolichol-phosphate mannosyltransferase
LKTLVIMPTYNEIESLPITLNAVLAATDEVDLLVVDDGSPDGTGAWADNLAATNNRVFVMHRAEKNGLGAAYLAGFAWAFERGYEYVVEMDADGSHRPQDLPKLLAKKEQADLVIGSRWVAGGAVENWPWYRELISRGGSTYSRLMLGVSIRDVTAGFRVYRSTFLQQLDLTDINAKGYGFQVEMSWRSSKAKARVIEVPILFVERTLGASKMSSSILLEALWLVTKWGFSRITN